MKKFLIKNEEEMANLAKIIANESKNHRIIGLKGTLGAGKSFFARNFINAIQEQKSEVQSPTFNLVLSYDTKIGEIFHFDLYRLKSADELENIGFFEAIKNSTCLIEWPEIAQNWLKKAANYLEIEIAINDDEKRVILIK
jgi:tRNA threonylcarbamoyladenosine biosynthesis protein TsaE